MAESNITERAYAQLRADIITCVLAPGSRLNVAKLQALLGLSQASVREALSRLGAEGLVEIEPNRGFRVACVSVNGFKDLTNALVHIELPCLRQSIQNGDTEWELNLVSSFHRAVRTLELVVAGKESINAYSIERLSFYEALLSACDSKWLLWSWRLLYAQNSRYRHMFNPLARFELELNPHHREILGAVLARDVEKVVELSIENYRRLSQFIEDKMKETAIPQPIRKVVGRPRKQSGQVANGHAQDSQTVDSKVATSRKRSRAMPVNR